MALSEFLPEYFSQEFERPEMFQYPYIMFATDRSGMVPAGGNKVSWPDVEGSVTSREYRRGTDLSEDEGDDAVLTLDIDQSDAVSIPLDDLDRIQKMPDVMGEYMIQADRELMWAINENNRSILEGGARRAASGLTEPMRGDSNGLKSNVKNLEFFAEGVTGTGHEVWGTEAAIQELIDSMDEDAGGYAKRHGWVSQDADTKGVAVVPIEVGNAFRKYLRDFKPNLGAGSIVDSAFGLGRIMKVAGWEIVEDVTLDEVNTGAAGSMSINFLNPSGRSVYYGRQLTTLETERIQKQFGTRLKALYLHGAAQGAARHIYGIDITLSTS